MIGSVLRKIAARLRGRYTQALENEIARLRAENRALVNSILRLAGIPPMRMAKVAQASAGRRISDEPNAVAGAGLAPLGRPKGGACENKSGDASVRSVRRRSWQQIGRAREVEDARAARRERETDTDAFPAPRDIVPRV